MELLTLFSAKSKCTVSFPFIKIQLTSKKDSQNVANRLMDAGKLLKVHFMLKLKVELVLKYYTFEMSKFLSFDHALDAKSFSILFCLQLNISRHINLQLKVSVSNFSYSSRYYSNWR